MLVLALDTTTRTGSLALMRDGVTLDVHVGDPGLTHGQRLPADIIGLLARQHVAISEVDLYAVAAGPGSFTGLRIGIATMQGLALSSGRGMVGVSALDALRAAGTSNEALMPDADALIGAWIDAQRGEVFAALYRGTALLDGPTVEPPQATLRRWAGLCHGLPVVLIGGGALMYAGIIRSILADDARIIDPVPPLAPVIARLAEMRAVAGEPLSPAGVQPLYVRRPDAELARDRARG